MRKNYWKYIVITLLASVALFHIGAVSMIWGESYELISGDYYAEESAYVDLVAHLKAGAPYRWESELAGEQFTLAVRDAANAVPALENVRVRLYKPNDASADRELTVTGTETGWSATTGTLPAGLWRVTVLAELDGETLAYKTTADL